MQESNGQEGKKILIVDDNQDNRELVVKILGKRGYVIFEADDGQNALDSALAEHPDLILMDISLPKMDGYEVTRRLKSMEGYKDIPVIALTAHAMKGDRDKALEAGCCDYISKPINIRELPRQVVEWIK